MKKVLVSVLALMIMAMPLAVSAGQPPDSQQQQPSNHDHPDNRDNHPDNRDNHPDNRDNHPDNRQEGPNNSMPFNWHDHRDNFSPDRHQIERIDDRDWHDKFPGKHPYRWHDRGGEGFFYHGHRITDAVFFYDDSDELISIGFMLNGIFIIIHADSGEERSNDSFFFAWLSKH